VHSKKIGTVLSVGLIHRFLFFMILGGSLVTDGVSVNFFLMKRRMEVAAFAHDPSLLRKLMPPRAYPEKYGPIASLESN
jgi:hypothetical protein